MAGNLPTYGSTSPPSVQRGIRFIQPQNHVFQSSIVVAAEEARRLTRALERALPDLPDHDAKAQLRQQRGGGIDYQEVEKLTALEWFSGTNKARLKEFISLCQKVAIGLPLPAILYSGSRPSGPLSVS